MKIKTMENHPGLNIPGLFEIFSNNSRSLSDALKIILQLESSKDTRFAEFPDETARLRRMQEEDKDVKFGALHKVRMMQGDIETITSLLDELEKELSE